MDRHTFTVGGKLTRLAAIAVVMAAALIAQTSPAGAQDAQEQPAAESGSSGGSMHQPGAFFDTSPQTRPMMVSAFTGIHYGYYAAYGFPLALSGRFYIPLVHNGFIPSVNDEFGIEPGLDFAITFLSGIYDEGTVFGFGVPVDAVWDFHITSSFDAYAKLGFVFGNVFSDYGYGGFWWTIRSAVGLRLKISETVYFRAEVGYPALLVGFGFAL